MLALETTLQIRVCVTLFYFLYLCSLCICYREEAAFETGGCFCVLRSIAQLLPLLALPAAACS